MQARRLLSTLFALTLVTSSCAALSSTEEAAVLPPPPPVDDTINTTVSFPDDGRTRLIVTPIATSDATDAAGGGAGGIEPSTPGGTDAPGADPAIPSLTLTPEMMAVMPPGAVLEARDGVVGYTDTDGEWFAFDPSLVPDTVAPEADQPEVLDAFFGHPDIDSLAADPAVKNVIAIGDGTFGIETTDPSVIDASRFTIVEDVPFGIAEDQYEGYQWHLENDGTSLSRVSSIRQIEDADLDITPTLERFDGSGVVVAVIDSGVDFSHPDLQNSAWANLDEVCGNGIDDDSNGYVDDCVGWDFAYGDNQPYNVGGNPHGTHVAGIITAERNGGGVAGVAPGTRIMDLNVAYPDGSMSGAAITAAIRYAVDNGADVINMSLGTEPGAPASGMGGMAAAIDYAAANGVLIVVAAGNSNVDIGSLPVYPASFDRPNMLVIGASNPDDTKADFSNYNSSIVDFYAPGVLVLSTMPGNDYRFMSGTSQASPATAGAAALLLEANPDATYDVVMEQLRSTVDRVAALSTSTTSGRANAASALGLGDAPPIPTEYSVLVSGLVDADNSVAAEVEIQTPPEGFSEEYRWELTLVQSTDTGAYAIVEHPFLIDGAEAATGLTGALVLGAADLQNVAVATDLPDGLYSFVVEAVPTADGNSRLGDAFVTTFQVGDGETQIGTTTTTTAPTATTQPPSDSPTTTAPSTTAPSDPGSDAPGDDPTDGATTTTTPGSDADANDGGSNPGGGSQDGATSTSTTAPSDGGSSPSTTTPAEPGTPVTTAPITSPPTTADPGADGPVTTAPVTTAPGSGGGTSPTTQAPATQPPTTQAPGGTTPAVPDGPAPVPPEVGDGTGKKGAWEITSISPQAGYVDTANTVTIRGNFPSQTYVWFGEQPGEVVFGSRDFMVVRTPLRATAGIVDLTLRQSRNGTVLEVLDAYAFVSFDGGVPDTDGPSTTQPPTTEPPSGGDDSSSTTQPPPGGDDSSSTTEPPTTEPPTTQPPSGDDGTGGGTDEQPTSERRPRMQVGTAVDLGNGLRGGVVTPNLAAGTPICVNDPCTAVRR